MKITTFINWAARRKTVRMVRRFPVSVLLLLGLAVKLFVDGIGSDSGIHSIRLDRLYAFLLAGMFISLTAALWLEERLRGWKPHAAVAAVALLWGAYCYLGAPPLSNGYFLEDNGWREFFGIIILHNERILSEFFTYNTLEPLMIAAGAALLVFIPFSGKGMDIAFGNFFSRMFFHFTLAYIIRFALFITTFTVMFGSIHDTRYWNKPWYIVTWIFCNVLFLPLWVMAHIPDKSAKHDNKPAKNQFTKVIGLILGTVAVIYAIALYLLYGYCLFTVWDSFFHAGGALKYVAVPIYILAVAWLLAAMFRHPSRPYDERRMCYWHKGCIYLSNMGEEECRGKCVSWIPISSPSRYNRFAAGLSRWFGAAILPLFVLMTAATIIHISGYGITIMSGYLILANLWFYGIYAYLFFTKARGVKWIPISLGALLIISSAGPWSVSNVTKRVLAANVTRSMDMNAHELLHYHNSARDMLYYALDNGIPNYLLNCVNERDRETVKGKIDYLLRAYVWKSKGKDSGEDELESCAAGDFTVRPAGKRKSVTIVGYAGNDTILDIPAKLNGKAVAQIGKDAFAGKGIVRVAIPRGVTAIGDRAFMHNKLTGVAIPNGVTAIGAEAFLANGLTGAVIPGSVTSIGERAFAHNELAGVKIPRGVKFIGSEAFDGNKQDIAVPKR